MSLVRSICFHKTLFYWQVIIHRKRIQISWRNDMKTLSALLALCEENLSVINGSATWILDVEQLSYGWFDLTWHSYDVTVVNTDSTQDTDVIMGTMASQMTVVSVVCWTVCSDQSKHQISASLAFVKGFPSQKVSNAENVFIRWRHHEQPTHLDLSSFPGMPPNVLICYDFKHIFQPILPFWKPGFSRIVLIPRTNPNHRPLENSHLHLLSCHVCNEYQTPESTYPVP